MRDRDSLHARGLYSMPWNQPPKSCACWSPAFNAPHALAPAVASAEKVLGAPDSQRFCDAAVCNRRDCNLTYALRTEEGTLLPCCALHCHAYAPRRNSHPAHIRNRFNTLYVRARPPSPSRGCNMGLLDAHTTSWYSEASSTATCTATTQTHTPDPIHCLPPHAIRPALGVSTFCWHVLIGSVCYHGAKRKHRQGSPGGTIMRLAHHAFSPSCVELRLDLGKGLALQAHRQSTQALAWNSQVGTGNGNWEACIRRRVPKQRQRTRKLASERLAWAVELNNGDGPI